MDLECKIALVAIAAIISVRRARKVARTVETIGVQVNGQWYMFPTLKAFQEWFLSQNKQGV